MTWIGVVSLFPELIRNGSRSGVLGRALEKGILGLNVFNPRDFALDRHRTVDDRPYGGGPGMVMRVEPLLAAIAAAKRAAEEAMGVLPRVIYLSPQGVPLSQQHVGHLADSVALVLVAGRYEGIDERILDLAIDEELSIGDYVLSGGEFPALVVMDAVARLLPGTLGNSESAVNESHLDGLLDYPHYTRPEVVQGRRVPAVLLSGDHLAVQRWRRKTALRRTWDRRPDLLVRQQLSRDDRQLLRESLDEAKNMTALDEE